MQVVFAHLAITQLADIGGRAQRNLVHAIAAPDHQRTLRTQLLAITLIMILIWLQLAIGLLTITQSLQHMDGAEMIRFMEWSQSVVTWNINAWVTVVDVHWLFKLHIFLGLIITMLFPFTRLVHIWSGFAAPFRYLVARSGYQIVRSRRRRQTIASQRPA